MAELESSLPVTYVCPHCPSGTQRLTRMTYAQWYGGHFIVIPNFPSWVCDVCREREYDAAALEQIRLMLGPESGLRRETGRRPGAGWSAFTPALRLSGRRPI